MKNFLSFSFAAWLACGSGPALANPIDTFSYRGPCGASAAVALDAEHFVVGNDEDNVLRIYRRGQAEEVAQAAPLALSDILRIAPGDEVDIEGATLVDRRIYWIGSHGRSDKCKWRACRQRLFATDIIDGAAVGLSPQLALPPQQAFAGLLEAIAKSAALRVYQLNDAAERSPEDEDGLNIEGLASTADGQLLIGLRSPLYRKRALLIPLLNPAEVIKGQPAMLGGAIELDLAERGIRGIERVGSQYLVIAGPTAGKGNFAVYRWSGSTAEAPQLLFDRFPKGLRPETLFAIPGSRRVQVLSDDSGAKAAGGGKCRDLPAHKQAFRSVTLTLPDRY